MSNWQAAGYSDFTKIPPMFYNEGCQNSISELTPTIVNEFVKESIVYVPDKSKENRLLQFVFNFIGEFILRDSCSTNRHTVLLR